MVFLILSCTNNSKIVPCCKNILIPKENIQVLLDSFVKENKHEKYMYELYIDKIDPDNFNMILYAGEKSLTQEENEYYGQKSVACVISQGVKIDIYSGIERFFNPSFTIDTFSLQNGLENNCNLLAIRDSMGILSSYKIEKGYPFIPFPLKNGPEDFTPPIIISK